MSWGKWQHERQSQLERLGKWTFAVVVAFLAQFPLIFGILHVIDRSVADIEFRSVSRSPVAVYEPELFDESTEAVQPTEVITEPELPPEPEPEEVRGTEVPVGQIVSVVPVEREEMPDRARYAARYANKVAREMRAREASRNQKVPERFAKLATPKRWPAPKKGELKAEARQTETMRRGVKATDSGEGLLVKEGSPVARGLPDRLVDGLAPFPAGLAGIDPVSKYSPSAAPFASDDYIGDVDEVGETNLLNTIPYRYAGFFERVKDRVRTQWHPNQVYRARDPSGELYGHKDRFTILSIVLDAEGRILDTTIIGASGLEFLDQEANRAFWAAGPFPNPPKGLVDEDGKIRFDFGFGFLIASSRHKFFWRWQ